MTTDQLVDIRYKKESLNHALAAKKKYEDRLIELRAEIESRKNRIARFEKICMEAGTLPSWAETSNLYYLECMNNDLGGAEYPYMRTERAIAGIKTRICEILEYLANTYQIILHDITYAKAKQVHREASVNLLHLLYHNNCQKGPSHADHKCTA